MLFQKGSKKIQLNTKEYHKSILIFKHKRFAFGIFSGCIICSDIYVCIQSEIWIEFEDSKN